MAALYIPFLLQVNHISTHSVLKNCQNNNFKKPNYQEVHKPYSYPVPLPQTKQNYQFQRTNHPTIISDGTIIDKLQTLNHNPENIHSLIKNYTKDLTFPVTFNL